MGVRKADFAGTWYPGTESECRRAIEAFSRESVPCAQKGNMGGIVPHAGWYYSGQIAFNVIKCLKDASPPDTIVIFGRHLHSGSPAYIMKEGSWSTPLGNLEIDADFAEMLSAEFKFTVETDTRYEQDNTVELQLPFIKYFFPDAKILPIGVPPKAASIRIGERVAEIAVEIKRRVYVIGSTDLTHYGHNYGNTPMGTGKKAVDWVKNENDKRMIDLILKMDPEAVISESLANSNACCSGAVAAAIAALKKLGAVRAETIIYKTSYDVRPDDSFVGYAGIVFGRGDNLKYQI
jgi:MEMO1 family protein